MDNRINFIGKVGDGVIVPNSIPRPLVRTNQWVIVLSVLAFWTSGVTWFMLIPFVSGLSGVLFNFNPVMRLAKVFLHKPMSSYIPEDKPQQQFNQWIAIVCLFVSMFACTVHWIVVGYTISALVFLSALIAICGFCIGCFIRFQWLRFQQRRRAHK
ncbi:DUF4395 domain-containing protein [Alicyclobacillus fastidiosus]|uniref:DUF4395 domain-containing protein n=1 Tax=Alicyclobacillus fastidiosus TaxID=392011 RepID=A0ABY6ZAT4_9BACL|nr:DUF4395 domain-containing protein [Alicyclobacillus fastidiosus]WAH39947.1 DUF4395 domain-containing protein [Alicyclobacillus fastidiosus]